MNFQNNEGKYHLGDAALVDGAVNLCDFSVMTTLCFNSIEIDPYAKKKKQVVMSADEIRKGNKSSQLSALQHVTRPGSILLRIMLDFED